MRSAPFITLAAVVVVLVAGAAGVYAYDSSRADVVADGISVGGVDVGGMDAGEARAAIKEQVAKPLEDPVKVQAAGQTFKLAAKRADVEIDIDGMVDAALARSREGNVLTRTVRDIGGGSVTADLGSRVSYSKKAVAGLVRDVKRRVDQPAQDASVEPGGGGLQTVAARKGRELQAAQLERAVAAQLEVPGDREVEARMKVVKPEVSTGEVADEYPVYLTVDRDSYELRYYRDLKLEETYEIAVGRVGFDTPSGLYHIQNKAVDPAWSVPDWGGDLAGKTIPGGAANNPLKSRWLGIYDGAGIHGTDDVASLGSAASHGCIRMAIPEVEELYDKVPVDAPIYIS